MEIFIEVRDAFKIFPKNLGYDMPLLPPVFFRDDGPFIGAADECIQECFFCDQAVQNDRQIHPDIIPTVSGLAVWLNRGFIEIVFQVIFISPEFFPKIICGIRMVGDKMPGAQIVLAKGLVNILDAGFRVFQQLEFNGIAD